MLVPAFVFPDILNNHLGCSGFSRSTPVVLQCSKTKSNSTPLEAVLVPTFALPDILDDHFGCSGLSRSTPVVLQCSKSKSQRYQVWSGRILRISTSGVFQSYSLSPYRSHHGSRLCPADIHDNHMWCSGFSGSAPMVSFCHIPSALIEATTAPDYVQQIFRHPLWSGRILRINAGVSDMLEKHLQPLEGATTFSL